MERCYIESIPPRTLLSSRKLTVRGQKKTMATKKQISDTLNAYLGLEDDRLIKFEKLDRKDLERLVELFDDPAALIKTIARSEAEDRLKERGKTILKRAEKAIDDLPRPFGLLDGVFGKKER